MVHSHLHLVSWLLINFVRIVSKSNANGFPLKISMNAHEKKNRIARILEMIWIMLLVIDWKSRFGIAPVANVGLYFKEFLIYSGCRWLRLNWFPAIDLHLAQIILSYSIELANKLKQIGYLSFWQNFPQMKIRTRSIYSDAWSTVNAIRCKNVSIVQCGSFGFRTTSGYSSNIIKYSHWNYSAPNVLNFIK